MRRVRVLFFFLNKEIWFVVRKLKSLKKGANTLNV